MKDAVKKDTYPVPKAAPTLQSLDDPPPRLSGADAFEALPYGWRRFVSFLVSIILKDKYKILGGVLVGVAISRVIPWESGWYIDGLWGFIGYWVVHGGIGLWRKVKNIYKK